MALLPGEPRWFPRTALPEMLGVAPAQFNNTRVHRVLERLETIEAELMRALSLDFARGGKPVRGDARVLS